MPVDSSDTRVRTALLAQPGDQGLVADGCVGELALQQRLILPDDGDGQTSPR